MVGATLGHYKIIEKIGVGGMGEVYRATDARLGRDVAIKLLPEAFARDPERLARFDQEARLLAALNHPNIAAIYGLEEAPGAGDGRTGPGGAGPSRAGRVQFLVLELVPGETLAERLGHGPLPVEEALGVCRQIAEALEAAHERGIIHRDLKPANVKVTPEGKVKVLDFGLAKAFAPEGEAMRAVSPSPAPGSPPDAFSQSPTLTFGATRSGMILGTAGYMSPEQARGKPLDKRTDIWSFGCVLYELLAGREAFAGETISDTIANILKREPDWSALPTDTPAAVRRLLRRCLEKEALRRLRDIGDARYEIEEPHEDRRDTGPGAARPGRTSVGALPWWIAALATVLAGVSLWVGGWQERKSSEVAYHMTIGLPQGQRLASDQPVPFAIAPDGKLLAYVAQIGSHSRIYLRQLDSFEAVPVPGTERARFPFFSPDGKWLAFFADRKLKKVPVEGGAPLAIVDAPGGLGGSWGPDNTIVFAGSLSSGLVRADAAGGEVKSLTRPDFGKSGYAHVYPHLLPDSQNVLFTVWGGEPMGTKAAILDLETGNWRPILPEASGTTYLDSGHLVYGDDMPRLLAVPFDLSRLEVRGAPVPVLHSVHDIPYSARPSYAVSPGGTLIYVPADDRGQTLVWVGHDGQPATFATDKGDFVAPRISTAGNRVAVTIGGDLWVIDVRRGTRRRLTFTEVTHGISQSAIWTPDDRAITFASNRAGAWSIYTIPVDGSGEAHLLLGGEYNLGPTSWSPSGRDLLFYRSAPDSGADIWVLPRGGAPAPLVATPFREGAATFSPDGYWIAFVSDESGIDEVYVQPFPGPGAKQMISAGGGTGPLWARDGKTLYYHNGDDMMAVPVQISPPFTPGTPRRLFSVPYEWHEWQNMRGANYDVAPDGSRLLMIQKSHASAVSELRVVVNWFKELKRLVPPAKY